MECNLDRYLSPELRKSTDAYIQERTLDQKEIAQGHILYRSLKIPYLEIEVPETDWQAILAEAHSQASSFVVHRAENSRGWKSLCLHGISAQHTMAYMDYGYKSELEVPYIWTEAANQCPATHNWLQKMQTFGFFEKFFRVRYMWLEPGGYIDFHRDRPEGKCELGPLNVAINMPAGCEWIFSKWGRVPFTAGAAMCVDISNEHAVFNFSNESRVHIILHGLYGPAYYSAIASATRKVNP